MAKKAKHIENRIRSTQHVKGAAVVHHDQIASKLAALAVEVQGPQTTATKEVFEIVLHFIGAALDHGGGKLDNAEIDVVAEKADDVGLREQRDNDEIALRNSCVRVKSTVTDALGEKALATYGLEGATPRGPQELLTHAQTVVKLLGERPFQKTVEGVTYDSTAIAMSVDAKANSLAKAGARRRVCKERGWRRIAILAFVRAEGRRSLRSCISDGKTGGRHIGENDYAVHSL